MELMYILKNRRAVREYADIRLERPVLDRLLSAATLAPSAMNLQPWAFAALLDPVRVEAYAQRAQTWLLENFSQTSFDPALRGLLESPGYSLFHHSPALVLVLAKFSSGQAFEDCCLAADHLVLAARDEGLGSCWIGLSRPWLNLPDVKAELGLPELYQVVAPITLGHPKSWPPSHNRKPAELHWIS